MGVYTTRDKKEALGLYQDAARMEELTAQEIATARAAQYGRGITYGDAPRRTPPGGLKLIRQCGSASVPAGASQSGRCLRKDTSPRRAPLLPASEKNSDTVKNTLRTCIRRGFKT